MRLVSLVTVVLVVPMMAIVSWSTGVRASEAEGWLNTKPVTVTKQMDLPDNQEPFSMGIDCTPMDFPTGHTNSGPLVHGCVFDGPFGQIGGNYYLNGPEGTLDVRLSSRGYFLPSLPNATVTFRSPSTWSRGVMIQIGNKTVSAPKYATSWGWPMQEYYTYEVTPERILGDASGQPMPFENGSVAYSPSGTWLAAVTTSGGIMVYDTTNYVGKTIAWSYGNMFYQETKGTNVAVSDDGRYVAINANLAAAGQTPIPTLRVYDTSTCTDQSQYVSNRGAGMSCQYKDLWNGTLGNTSYGGIVTEHPELEYPRNIRFTSDGSLTFDSVYARSSATSFSVARYSIPLGGATKEPIRLLAMGDSYISGEGAYSYISGTDTANNKCHQSTVSYPYLLGASLASEYHSVACAGAVVNDIVPRDDDMYPGQVDDKKHWYDRNQQEILGAYIPGYAGQHLFIESVKPNTVLLSIGGNDIAFAKIVTRCAISFAWDPCYHRQSERKSLLLTIYSKYHALKTTYAKILSEAPSGARLYVVGYPQVVNTTGNCGVNVHLDDSERQFAELLIDRLNSTIKAAADSSGVVYVDISSALVGHRLCDVTDDGVNGLTSGDDKLSIGFFIGSKTHSFGIGNESYHPTALGHELINNAIASETEGLTKESQGAVNVLLPKIQDDDEFITTGAVDDRKALPIQHQEIVDANIVSSGSSVGLDIDPTASGLRQGSAYQVVFHSDEVVVASGTLPSSGKLHLNITVPKLTPGIHSVHVYTKDVNGEDIDVTEDVYIVASEDDFDGDGIRNDEDSLPFINETGTIITTSTTTETTSANQEDQSPTQTTRPSMQAATTTQSAALTNFAGQQIASSTPTVLGASDTTVSAITIDPKVTEKTKDSHDWVYGVAISLAVTFAGILALWIYRRSKNNLVE